MFSRDRHVRIERVALEDHGDVAVARLQARDVAVADQHAPGVGCSRPARMRSAVVLPQPDGPEQGEEAAGRARRDRGRAAPRPSRSASRRLRSAPRSPRRPRPWSKSNGSRTACPAVAPRHVAAGLPILMPSSSGMRRSAARCRAAPARPSSAPAPRRWRRRGTPAAARGRPLRSSCEGPGFPARDHRRRVAP